MHAKFRCDSVRHYPDDSEEAELSAVYADGEPENNQFSEATPSGELVLHVTNSDVYGFFSPGEEYFLDITPATEAEADDEE